MAVAVAVAVAALSWTSGGGTTSDYRISYQRGATAPASCAAGTQISEAAISGTSHAVTGLTHETSSSEAISVVLDRKNERAIQSLFEEAKERRSVLSKSEIKTSQQIGLIQTILEQAIELTKVDPVDQ